MLRDVFSEASRIETHNCHIPSLTLTRCACMTKQLMAQETCAGTRRLGVCASPIEATFPPEEHLLRIPTKASAQDPREIEGLPLARRRSACCSQPRGTMVQTMHVLECQLLTMETVMQTGTHIPVLLFVHHCLHG